tara:strand:+ start:9625 stop:9915 length:291 start_codon:yes stop_codon:yes gene_type:complete
MAVYSISSINVKDWDKYQEYMKHVPPIIEQYGGRYLVRGGEIIADNTDWELKRIVILEFPTIDQMNAFRNSPEYAPVAAIRYEAADTVGFTVSDNE